MTKKHSIGRPGDVVRVPSLGPIKPHAGHDLIAIFLGACKHGEEPNAAAALHDLGWSRAHVFELTLHWRNEDITRQLFTADTPTEAAESAIRAAARVNDANQLTGLMLRLMRLGPISMEGKPHNGRGQVFFAWAAESGRPLDLELLRSESAESAGS